MTIDWKTEAIALNKSFVGRLRLDYDPDPTTVLNVSRLTRDQRAALVADPTFVYVGRQFAGWPGSVFGNPFKVGMSFLEACAVINRASANHAIIIRVPEMSGLLTASQAVECYRLCRTGHSWAAG